MNRKLLFPLIISLLATCLVNGQAPVANFQMNYTPPTCVPLLVSFVDKSTGTPTSWSWTFSGPSVTPTSSIAQNPSAIFNAAGTYTITLIATNANGSSTPFSQNLTINPSPVADFTASDSVGCYPTSINFTNLSTAGAGATISSWTWDFGDGVTDIVNFNTTHKYTFAGSFPVTLYVTNSFGCTGNAAIKTVSGYININNGIIPNFNDSLSQSCNPPTSAFFSNLTTGPGTITYNWNFGDGVNSVLTNPTHTYTTAGNYQVVLVASSDQGCVDTAKATLSIISGSVTSSFLAPDSVCLGSPITFQNNSSPTPNSAIWNFGDGSPNSTLISPTHTYASAGSFRVTLNNTFASCSDSVSKIITVFTPAVANFTALNTVSCKPPLAVHFQDLSTGATHWFWDFGDGVTSILQNPVHTYNSYGQFNVQLTVFNASGCGNKIFKGNFVQIVKPSVTITNLPAYGCSPFTYSPTIAVVAVDGVASYSWNFGNGFTFNGASPPAQVYTAGKYAVSLTIVTNGGCTASFTDTVKVGTTKPVPAFTAAPTTVCVNQNVQFTDQSTGGANQWLWDFGDGGSSTAQDPSYGYTKSGTFSVKLTAFNDGCFDTLTKVNYIVVSPPSAGFSYSFTCAQKNQVTFVDTSVGATTWLWDFGDGTTSTASAPPPHLYPPVTATYTVKLTVTNGGCSSTTTTLVNILQKVNFVSTANSICKNTTITISATLSNNIKSYTFDFGDGSPRVGPCFCSNANHLYTTPGSYTVTVITTDSTGCPDSVSKVNFIQVNGSTANFTTPVTQACGSLAASFTDLSTTNPGNTLKNWSWDFGDGGTSILQSPMHTYTTQGIFPVKLRVTDATGCSDSIIKSSYVTVSVPKAKFVTADSFYCPNSIIKFTNASTGGYNPVYNWDFGDGTTFSGTNPPTHTYAAVGNYTIKLTISDMFGCLDSMVKNNFIVIDTPVASFTISDSFAACPPLLVHFTFTGSYYKKLLWDFNDRGAGSVDSLNTVHLYSIPNTYLPKLTVISPGGCLATATKTIQVLGPFGIFSYAPLGGCDTATINFNVVTSGVTKFNWVFGDGTSQTTDSSYTTHFYSAPPDYKTVYIPSVELTDASGCRVPLLGTDTIVIVAIKPEFVMDKTTTCEDNSIQFTDSTKTNGKITNYFWDFGDGTFLNGSFPNPSHFYPNAGLYNVKMIVTTQFGCQDSVIHQLKVVANPVIDIGGSISQCAVATLNFTGLVLVPDTSTLYWSWDFDNGQTSTLQNPASQIYDKAGHYIITANVVNSSGCVDSASSDLFIYPIPVVDAGADTTICLGQTASLLATGAATYNWLPPSNSSLSCNNCPNPIASPIVNTSYYVTGTSSLGCQATDTVVVNVNQPVTVTVGPPDSVCIGQGVPLSASGAFFYTWSPAAGLSNPNIADPIASPGLTTNYMVIGNDSKYCFSDTQHVQITVFNYPTINVGPDVTILVGSSYQINGSGSADIVSINWLPTTGLSCTSCFSPLATPIKTTTYVATVINDGTCVSSDSVKITVICNDNNLFVPNTFSPNGDGVNDVFFVRGKGINTIPAITIFNRWGQVVFEKRDFAPNDPSAGWDGTINGVKAPVDVYVYTVEIICDNATLIPYHGNVTLIR